MGSFLSLCPLKSFNTDVTYSISVCTCTREAEVRHTPGLSSEEVSYYKEWLSPDVCQTLHVVLLEWSHKEDRPQKYQDRLITKKRIGTEIFFGWCSELNPSFGSIFHLPSQPPGSLCSLCDSAANINSCRSSECQECWREESVRCLEHCPFSHLCTPGLTALWVIVSERGWRWLLCGNILKRGFCSFPSERACIGLETVDLNNQSILVDSESLQLTLTFRNKHCVTSLLAVKYFNNTGLEEVDLCSYYKVLDERKPLPAKSIDDVTHFLLNVY